MGNRPTVTAPWQVISLDFIGPLARLPQGYTNVLVVTHHHTKYVALFSVRNITSKIPAQHMEEGIFLVYGTPKL